MSQWVDITEAADLTQWVDITEAGDLEQWVDAVNEIIPVFTFYTKDRNYYFEAGVVK